jgi:hypothetical protein
VGHCRDDALPMSPEEVRRDAEALLARLGPDPDAELHRAILLQAVNKDERREHSLARAVSAARNGLPPEPSPPPARTRDPLGVWPPVRKRVRRGIAC